MTRRHFFSSLARTSLVAMASISFPVLTVGASISPSSASKEATLGGAAYRGTAQGRIITLAADGNWRQVVDLGAHLSVQEIVARQGQLYARMVYQGLSFYLSSSDGRVWRTAERIPAAT